MGFLKKLFKGKFKKLGRQVKSIGKGKFLRGVSKFGSKLVKTAGAVFSSGLLPVPGGGLIGRALTGVSNIGKSKFGGKLVKGGQIFGQVRAAITPRPMSPYARKPALPRINKSLTSSQRKVFGQPSFIRPSAASAAAAIKRALNKKLMAKVAPVAPVKRLIIPVPRRPMFVPRTKLANLNIGTSTAPAKKPGALTTTNKIAVAGIGLSALILIARLLPK